MKRTDVLALVLGVGSISLPAAAGTPMHVYKVRGCQCCEKWTAHLRADGFDVDVEEVNNTAEYRQKYGIPDSLKSCHTAVVGGYAIEGHVPAQDIQRLLREHPIAKGLAVRGMPVGSPGMEGSPPEAYNVVLVDKNQLSVFQRYPGK